MPAGARVGREERYGNAVLYFEAGPGADGTLPFSIVYHVVRKEAGVTAEGPEGQGSPRANRADRAPRRTPPRTTCSSGPTPGYRSAASH